MNLASVIQSVLETHRLTPDIEGQIHDLIWSRTANEADLSALEHLLAGLVSGAVHYTAHS
ncbi:hypothetical protein DO97_09440 [Neosynechococcus sphagnicola sy1]|uniref:Uncharacterized protein n=1 Tax=Neosynechococcus sphagnicola sy1 TaxID=1497020 RepID=A0A098TIB9_9CYAN|nr:hypothetical protein [Neosynechococcus sphagnicola]KGF72320.1 hypothetical protein DO97_09440 [Neosynechococcus sphagnicola sy1]